MTTDPVSSNWAYDHEQAVAQHVDLTITGAQIEALLMFGADNAEYVPCMLDHWQPAAAFEFASTGYVENTGATDGLIYASLPLPTSIGGLKLYISGTRVGLDDADADDYVTNTYVMGYTGGTRTNEDIDTTDKQTVGDHDDDFDAIDMSGYSRVVGAVMTVCTDANQFGLAYICLKCYYAA